MGIVTSKTVRSSMNYYNGLKNNPRLSIVIVNYNTYDILNELIKFIEDNLKNKKIFYEIIIIDNSIIKKEIVKIKNLKVLNIKKNIGFTKALNFGILNSKYDYILILTPDVKISSKSIEVILEYLSQKQKVLNKYIIGFYILDGRTGKVDSSGGTLSYITGLPIVFKSFRSKYVLYPGGAVLLVKKQMLRDIGYYDNDLFAYNDEVDLSLKAWLNGFGVLIDPKLVAIHYPKASFGKTEELLKLREYLIIRNLISIWLKYFGLFVTMRFVAASIILKIMSRNKSSVNNINLPIMKYAIYAFKHILLNMKTLIIERYNINKKYGRRYKIILKLMKYFTKNE